MIYGAFGVELDPTTDAGRIFEVGMPTQITLSGRSCFFDGERDAITRNTPVGSFTYSSKFVTLQVLSAEALAPDLVAMTTGFAPRGPV